jgi:hypothetical protein
MTLYVLVASALQLTASSWTNPYFFPPLQLTTLGFPNPQKTSPYQMTAAMKNNFLFTTITVYQTHIGISYRPVVTAN